MKEIWKNIQGYEGSYQISNLGNVRSLTRKVSTFYGFRIIKGQLLKPLVSKNGYLRICLKNHQQNAYFLIHRLVAQAFIPNPDNYPIVNHKDNNQLNNNVSNLEWCTQKYNVKYSYTNGNAKPTSGCFKKGHIPCNRKKIYQYDLNGNLLSIFNSIKEASLYVKTVPTNISNCLLGYTKKAKGYIWKYAKN